MSSTPGSAQLHDHGQRGDLGTVQAPLVPSKEGMALQTGPGVA